MRIYVAAKTHEFLRARAVMNELMAQGHVITFDWTSQVEKVGPDHQHEAAQDDAYLAQCAENDINGVKTCQLLIALGHPRLCGTLIEIGMALALGKKIITVGEFPPSVFWRHPNVVALDTINQMLSHVKSHTIVGKGETTPAT